MVLSLQLSIHMLPIIHFFGSCSILEVILNIFRGLIVHGNLIKYYTRTSFCSLDLQGKRRFSMVGYIGFLCDVGEDSYPLIYINRGEGMLVHKTFSCLDVSLYQLLINGVRSCDTNKLVGRISEEHETTKTIITTIRTPYTFKPLY